LTLTTSYFLFIFSSLKLIRGRDFELCHGQENILIKLAEIRVVKKKLTGRKITRVKRQNSEGYVGLAR
jgi:hypothetical protein